MPVSFQLDKSPCIEEGLAHDSKISEHWTASDGEHPVVHRRERRVTTSTVLAHSVHTKVSHFKRSEIGGLLGAIVLGAVAVFLQRAEWFRGVIFGEHFQREWVWWVVFVPIYLFAAIYGIRFLGTFLLKHWIRDVIRSDFTQHAVATLITGIMGDPAVPKALGDTLQNPNVTYAASHLAGIVLRSPDVQTAAFHALERGARDPELLQAVADSAAVLLQSPSLQRGTEAFFTNSNLAEPMVKQMGGILADERTVASAAVFTEALLAQKNLRRVIKDRAESLVAEPRIFEAGSKALHSAMMPTWFRPVADGSPMQGRPLEEERLEDYAINL